MSDAAKTYPVPAEFAAKANLSPETYREMYAASISDPEAFWGEHGKRLDWIKPYSTVRNTDFALGGVSIKWFEDGVLNICHNAVDRHVAAGHGASTALIFGAANSSPLPLVARKMPIGNPNEVATRAATATMNRLSPVAWMIRLMSSGDITETLR